jgi:hypothetical protein
MNHPIEQEELMAYLDGELALDRAAKAATHLEKCRDCQSLAGDLQSVSRKMMAWQVESPDDLRMSQAIGAALDERERTKEKPAVSRRLGWLEALGIPRLPRWAFRGGLAIAVLVVMVVLFNSTFVTRQSALHGFLGSERMRATPETAPASQPASPGFFGYDATGKLESSRTRGGNKTGEAEETQTTAGSGGYAYDIGDKLVPAQPKPHSAAPPGPMVVRKASLALITKDFDQSRAAMEETLKRHGGYIGQLTVSAPDENGRTLTATLRIPAGQLDAALAELKKLGRVADESQSGEEVTQQYVDLEARLANAKNSEQRLTDILRNRTGKLADVLEVEQAIEEVRGNIEQMEAERKNLAKQVDFATLSATLTEEYQGQLHAVPVSTFTRIWNAAVDGYGTLTESVVNVVLFLFSYGPVLLLWGAVLFFPARAIWRRLRKRMKAAS